MFRVELAEARSSDTKIYLNVDDSGDGSQGSDFYDFGDGTYPISYESSPGVWTAVSSDGTGYYITIPASSTVNPATGEPYTYMDVKIKTIDDGTADDGESLILNATLDDTATYTDMANTTASAGTIITEYPSVWVSAPTSVNEGGDGIFEVGFSSATTEDTDVVITLSGEATSADYNAVLNVSYDEGVTWTQTINNGGTITIPTGTGTAWVKIATIDDGTGTGEGDESMAILPAMIR